MEDNTEFIKTLNHDEYPTTNIVENRNEAFFVFERDEIVDSVAPFVVWDKKEIRLFESSSVSRKPWPVSSSELKLTA